MQSIAENTVQPTCIALVKDGIINHELESVISEWQSKLPLKVVGYEKNQGLAYALNYGLQFVETELVARMDSDDICFQTDLKNRLPSLK
ncbi:MAG: glycosyltransferase [Treponema succinifaciens]|nr:MAG: glycosyltransferase [Treponema succinifaciens]